MRFPTGGRQRIPRNACEPASAFPREGSADPVQCRSRRLEAAVRRWLPRVRMKEDGIAATARWRGCVRLPHACGGVFRFSCCGKRHYADLCANAAASRQSDPSQSFASARLPFGRGCADVRARFPFREPVRRSRPGVRMACVAALRQQPLFIHFRAHGSRVRRCPAPAICPCAFSSATPELTCSLALSKASAAWP